LFLAPGCPLGRAFPLPDSRRASRSARRAARPARLQGAHRRRVRRRRRPARRAAGRPRRPSPYIPLDPLRPRRDPLTGALPGGLDGLPLRASAGDARWRGARAQGLFNHLGDDYASPYCDDDCHRDHHPSIAAQYLNACVFYATLFGRSPVGAAFPDGRTEVDGMRLPALAGAAEAAALQRIAAAVVLEHMGVWWGGAAEPLG